MVYGLWFMVHGLKPCALRYLFTSRMVMVLPTGSTRQSTNSFHPTYTLCKPYVYPMYTLFIPYLYLIYTLCIPYVYPMYTLFIPYLYLVYTLFIPYVYHIYTLFIPCVYSTFAIFIPYLFTSRMVMVLPAGNTRQSPSSFHPISTIASLAPGTWVMAAAIFSLVRRICRRGW